MITLPIDVPRALVSIAEMTSRTNKAVQIPVLMTFIIIKVRGFNLCRAKRMISVIVRTKHKTQMLIHTEITLGSRNVSLNHARRVQKYKHAGRQINFIVRNSWSIFIKIIGIIVVVLWWRDDVGCKSKNHNHYWHEQYLESPKWNEHSFPPWCMGVTGGHFGK